MVVGDGSSQQWGCRVPVGLGSLVRVGVGTGGTKLRWRALICTWKKGHAGFEGALRTKGKGGLRGRFGRQAMRWSWRCLTYGGGGRGSWDSDGPVTCGR